MPPPPPPPSVSMSVSGRLRVTTLLVATTPPPDPPPPDPPPASSSSSSSSSSSVRLGRRGHVAHVGERRRVLAVERADGRSHQVVGLLRHDLVLVHVSVVHVCGVVRVHVGIEGIHGGLPRHVRDVRGGDHPRGPSIPARAISRRVLGALGGVAAVGRARVALARVGGESLAFHAGVVGESERAGARDGDAHEGAHREDGRAVGRWPRRRRERAAHRRRRRCERATSRTEGLLRVVYRFKMARATRGGARTRGDSVAPWGLLRRACVSRGDRARRFAWSDRRGGVRNDPGGASARTTSTGSTRAA